MIQSASKVELKLDLPRASLEGTFQENLQLDANWY